MGERFFLDFLGKIEKKNVFFVKVEKTCFCSFWGLLFSQLLMAGPFGATPFRQLNILLNTQ